MYIFRLFKLAHRALFAVILCFSRSPSPLDSLPFFLSSPPLYSLLLCELSLQTP